MNYKIIDYEEVATAILKKEGKAYTSSYLRGVAEGRYNSKVAEKMINACKGKRFDKINYRSLAVSVSKKLNRPYSANYIKNVLDGSYKSDLVKKTAKKLLKEK